MDITSNAGGIMRIKTNMRMLWVVCAMILSGPLAARAQMVAANPLSPLKSKKVMVLEGGSISGEHLDARTATYANLQGFAKAVGFTLVKGDPKNLTDANLNDVDILVFSYFFETQTATAFPDLSKAAFQKWLAKGGKGYVGFHTSGANEWLKDEWKWYQDNVTSMRYALHGTGVPQGKVDKTTDAAILANPIMEGLPPTFTAADEWYAYDATSKVLDPASGCKVMYYLTNAQALDRAPLGVHPVAWYREDAAKSRYFYSTFIHTPDGANSTWFKSILLRALEYTSGDPSTAILTEKGKSAMTLGNRSYVTSGRDFSVDLKGHYNVSVWSSKGEKVYSARGSEKMTFAPAAFSKPGLYLVKVASKAKTFSQRIMVY
ncbi:MAG: hypothetical protein JWP91_4165 [Fibrobacteres bacterium]|nr:hypothetical protein [Fibrobacterota bacterium]